jgi:hypothetical protein
MAYEVDIDCQLDESCKKDVHLNNIVIKIKNMQ